MLYKINYFASVMPMYVQWEGVSETIQKVTESNVVFVDFLNKKVYGIGGLVVPDQLSDSIFQAMKSSKPVSISNNMEQIDEIIKTVMKKEDQIAAKAEEFAKKTTQTTQNEINEDEDEDEDEEIKTKTKEGQDDRSI